MKHIRSRFVYININSRPWEGHWSNDARCKHHRVKYVYETRSCSSLPSPFSLLSLILFFPSLLSLSFYFIRPFVCQYYPRATLVTVGTWFRACQAWKMSRYFSPDRKNTENDGAFLPSLKRIFFYHEIPGYIDFWVIFMDWWALGSQSAIVETRIKLETLRETYIRSRSFSCIAETKKYMLISTYIHTHTHVCVCVYIYIYIYIYIERERERERERDNVLQLFISQKLLYIFVFGA